jgi:hypothetical protein
MRRITYLLAFVSACLLTGCGSQKLANRHELQGLIEGVQGRQSGFWQGTFYCGTKGKYHYILHKVQPDTRLWFIIPTNELVVLAPFPLTHDESKYIDISELRDGDAVNGKRP